MIDVKEAVRKAREYSRDVLGEDGTVEEIERELYRERDVWRITLGFAVVYRFAGPQKEYKSFFIDAETGETLAVKIRELAA